MYEVLEIIQKLILLLELTYFAWWDYRTQKIALLPGVLFIMGGMLCHLLTGQNGIGEVFFSMVVGLILLVVSFVYSEGIGTGDGLLFLVSGSYLNFANQILLLMGTLYLLGGVAVLCLLLKKKKPKDRIAMAPFMLGAYVIFVI